MKLTSLLLAHIGLQQWGTNCRGLCKLLPINGEVRQQRKSFACAFTREGYRRNRKAIARHHAPAVIRLFFARH